MILGVCKIYLSLNNVYSLKEKRHIIKSIIGKLKVKFNISISEVSLNDNHQISVVGFSCVSNNGQHADSMISNVLNFIENYCAAEIIDCFRETINYSKEDY